MPDKQYLLDALALFDSAESPAQGYVYNSMYELLLREGEWFTMIGNHPLVGLGRPGYCFWNAYKRVVDLAPLIEVDYVEGFAITAMGLGHHAWLSWPRSNKARSQLALDVTWPWPHPSLGAIADALYYGVRVPLDPLRVHWLTCGSASFLSDIYHDNLPLKIPYPEWPSRLPAALFEVIGTHCHEEVLAGRARVVGSGIWHAEHLQ